MFKFSRKFCIFWIVILSLTLLENFTKAEDREEYIEKESCGDTQPIPGDHRTYIPWISAIFIRSKENGPYRFFIQGVLIGPTTIVSLLGGAFGILPRGSRGNYRIFHPKYLLVGFGLKSTNISDVDQYTQFRKVTYMNPFKSHSLDNQDYHVFVLHLEKPVNLSTPYVRTICLSPLFLSVLSSFEKESFIGGFGTPRLGAGKVYGLWAQSNLYLTGTQQSCERISKFYYRGTSDFSNIYCGRVQYKNELEQKNCFLHASSIYYTVGSGIVRAYIAALVAMIPRKHWQWEECQESLLYLGAPLFQETSWLYDNLDCSPNKFSCGNNDDLNTSCIPLEKVCNFISDCPSDSDEDPIYCEAANYCKNGLKACSLYSSVCISEKQICDGIPNCPEGNDEYQEVCEKNEILKIVKNKLGINRKGDNLNNLKEIEEIKFCPQLPKGEGTIIQCRSKSGAEINCDVASVGSSAILTCAPYYVSKFRVNSLRMKCDGNYLWKPFRAFGCKLDCGIIDSTFSPLISRGRPADLRNYFPWYGAIFKRNSYTRQYNFICGASLIERNVLITAAHCVGNKFGVEVHTTELVVILAPYSSQYEENLNPGLENVTKIFKVKWIRIPKTYNFHSLESDIALIGLQDSVNFSQYIRPVCYLQPRNNLVPNPGSLGKIAGLGFDETFNLSDSLRYTEMPVVSNFECKKRIDSSIIQYKSFCAGFRNGSAGLCRGDSGGGFVMLDNPNPKSIIKRYVLKGIVSHGGQKDLDGNKICVAQDYAIFSHVDSYVDWILDTLENMDVIY